MIDGEGNFFNSGNSTDCADISSSGDSVDELITTAINSGDSMYFAEYSTGEFIAAINDGN